MDNEPIRKTASDFDQELLNLYDKFAHGLIERREFLDRAAKFAVGGVTAAALLNSLSPKYALAKQVDEMDPRIKGELIDYCCAPGRGCRFHRAGAGRVDAAGRLSGYRRRRQGDAEDARQG
jgi:hypothetical protein